MLRLRQPFLTGEDVKTWQTQMAKRGWRIDTDGIFGPGAEAICRKFQAEKGIGADGIVGPDTWRATWESVITPG
jgi:peptidoglycan hydrolase-like protein with peptidoglycan-binding domain